MKKFISMVLVLVMAMFATSGLQCFAKNNFDAKSASVDETIREIEKQIIADNSLDSKAKKELLNNIDALKKKSKSKKHMMSLAWDKVKGTATTVGSATVGGAAGLFAGACIFSEKSSSKLALALDGLIIRSSTLSACKRWLEKKIVGNDFYYGIKEDIIKVIGLLSLQ